MSQAIDESSEAISIAMDPPGEEVGMKGPPGRLGQSFLERATLLEQVTMNAAECEPVKEISGFITGWQEEGHMRGKVAFPSSPPIP